MALEDLAFTPRRRLGRALGRISSRRVGNLRGEIGAAATAAHAFALFCVALTVAYIGFYWWLDPMGLQTLHTVLIGCTVMYALAIVVLRLGYQLAGSLILLTTAAFEVLVSTASVGWMVGIHLFLIAGAHLAFMVFTERQTVYRWLFVGIAAFCFVFCQVLIDPANVPYRFSPGLEETLFSINAVLVGVVMFALAASHHHRAQSAQATARAAAVRAEYLANTDPLTGLENRRPIMDRLEGLAKRSSAAYSVSIIDLDRFKQLNDTFGHVCGDNVLTAVGQRLRSRLRGSDAVGRWGGEEFIVVLPETRLADAEALMERLRREIDRSPIACGTHVHHITASFGVADGRNGSSTHRLIKRADDAMYEAKMGGRNTVRAHQYDSEELPESMRAVRARHADEQAR